MKIDVHTMNYLFGIDAELISWGETDDLHGLFELTFSYEGATYETVVIYENTCPDTKEFEHSIYLNGEYMFFNGSELIKDLRTLSLLQIKYKINN